MAEDFEVVFFRPCSILLVYVRLCCNNVSLVFFLGSFHVKSTQILILTDLSVNTILVLIRCLLRY